MADTNTSNLNLVKPEVGASSDTWGTKLNANLDALDALFATGPALLVAKGGTGATTASGARSNLGLGSIATQNASAVAITGGSISGITDLAIADGGTGASTAADARTNLGLGSIATQAANNVAITGGAISGVAVTGGSVSGITDLAVADGGTGASSAVDARANLGLAIGTNIQAYDATLQSLSGLGTAADKFAYTTGVDTWVEGTITAAGRAILDDADAAAQRTTLGLGSAATLTAGTSANNLVQLDGSARLPAVDGSQLTGISAGFSMPAGAVMPYAGATEPSGWLFCYGQAVSRTTYAALFAVLSTTYGAGDGSTTFNLPDLRGRVVAGQDDMGGTSANRLTGLSGGVDGDVLGGAGGAETHTLTEAQMPSHTHTFNSRSGTGGSSAPLYSTGVTTLQQITTTSAGSDQAHNNVQPTLILNYIIKT